MGLNELIKYDHNLYDLKFWNIVGSFMFVFPDLRKPFYLTLSAVC